MVIGEANSGKTSFIDMFINYKFKFKSKSSDKSSHGQYEKGVCEFRGIREENGLRVDQGTIDTPGFGKDQSHKDWYKIIKKEIANRMDRYKKEKKKIDQKNIMGSYEINSNNIVDDRVHVILYFTSSTRIRREEANYIKKQTALSNIIPIFSKGDCHTHDEIVRLKENVMKDSAREGIKWFNCKEALKNYPEKEKQMESSIFGRCPPFLVINANDIIIYEDMKTSMGRKYSWGICEIENPNHTDFQLFYNLLIGYFSFPCKKLTEIFYENYFEKKKIKLLKQIKKDKSGHSKLEFGLGLVLGFGLVGTLYANKRFLNK